MFIKIYSCLLIFALIVVTFILVCIFVYCIFDTEFVQFCTCEQYLNFLLCARINNFVSTQQTLKPCRRQSKSIWYVSMCKTANVRL